LSIATTARHWRPTRHLLTTNVETKIKKEIFVKGKKGPFRLQSTILRDLWPVFFARMTLAMIRWELLTGLPLYVWPRRGVRLLEQTE